MTEKSGSQSDLYPRNTAADKVEVAEIQKMPLQMSGEPVSSPHMH